MPEARFYKMEETLDAFFVIYALTKKYARKPLSFIVPTRIEYPVLKALRFASFDGHGKSRVVQWTAGKPTMKHVRQYKEMQREMHPGKYNPNRNKKPEPEPIKKTPKDSTTKMLMEMEESLDLMRKSIEEIFKRVDCLTATVKRQTDFIIQDLRGEHKFMDENLFTDLSGKAV